MLTEINSIETQGIIPGKLFEYMAAKRPILAIGPKNWDVGEIISETKSGILFDYSQESKLKEILLNWFNAFENNELEIDSKNIDKYSRRELTKKLAELL